MRHYLRGLAALIEEGHTDEALGRIDALCETNDRTAVRRYCANETVNIALSSLSADINARGITADLRAAVPETVHVGDVDLFSVVSNALDNAIAAASAAPEGKRFVDLDLRHEDGQLLLAGFQHVWPCAAHGRRHARGSAHWARLWHQEH